MFRVTNSIMINRPLADVFQYTVDFENMNSWGYKIQKSRKLSAKNQLDYPYYEVDLDLIAFVEMKSLYEIMNVEDNKHIYAKLDADIFNINDSFYFEEIDGQTKVTLNSTVDLRNISLFEFFWKPMAIAGLSKRLEGLKNVLN